MPDDPGLAGTGGGAMGPAIFLGAMAAAALCAAVIILLFGWPWRKPSLVRVSAGSVLGMALGLGVGCWWLGIHPHWPPREDQDRLLLVLLPAVLVVELLAALAGRLRWLAWPLRLLIAAGAGRVLLHHSSYLADLSGPGTREWPPALSWLILGTLAVALAVVWTALAVLARRSPGRSVPAALVLTCAGAAVAVMLSGYASGGQTGLVLAAALAGVGLASLVLAGPVPAEGMIGVAVVGLFALLVVGCCFGQLGVLPAALLLCGPLLCWVPELPYLRRLGPRLRGLGRVVTTAVPVAVVLVLAMQKFVADSSQTSQGAREATLQDYMDYGK